MRLLLLCALLAVPASLSAQTLGPPTPITDGVIRLLEEDMILSRSMPDSAITVTATPDDHGLGRHQHYDRRFWVGVVMAAAGGALIVASVTSEQRSDLSKEDPRARLGVHLAPCGTDPSDTALAIADCEPHYGLLGFGSGLLGVGSFLMFQSNHAHPQIAGLRVRF
jgi:hypothetical protein